MTQEGTASPRQRSRFLGLPSFVAAAAVIGVILCAIGISVLANGVWREVDALAAANSDTTQWSLAQTEVELLTLLVAIHAGQHEAEPNLQDVRNRFNVLYSRVSLLREGQQFGGLRADPSVSGNLNAIATVLDRHVPVIDGPDPALIAALPQIEQELVGLRPSVRDFSLLGVRLFASDSDAQRETLAELLARIGYLTLALVLALMGGIGILMAMFRRSAGAERAAGDARNRLQEVISTSFDAILGADIDGRLIEYNGAAERIFGYSRAEAIGGDMADLIIPDHLKKAHAAGMQRYRETRERHVVGKGLIRLEARRKDGTVFPVEMSLSSAIYDGKEIFVSYLRDISDRVAAEQELIKTRDRAVQGERAKADLLAVMSHEMRTPLNGILGTIELLKGSKLTAQQDRYISAMNTSAGLLLHHVNGVLSMSRAEAGQLDLRVAELNPSTLLHELVESQRHVIEANGNQILCDTSAAPELIWADALRLRQVILNLVGNANKFTRRGEIRLECDSIPDSHQVEFRVMDTGIGIPEEELESIFEEFRTLDSSYSRQAEGTGLGLAIARRLVRAMGGEIGVDSEPGEGSLFWVRLPIGEPQQQKRKSTTGPAKRKPVSATDTVPDRKLNVLLVEDNQINRLVARDMLNKCGHTVFEAHDGREGVRFASRQAFDVILMDISMPELDGIAATSIIRDADGPNRTTPIIALTAHALPEDAARFHAAGITSTLLKPLSIATLKTALANATNRLSEPAMHEAEPQMLSVHAGLVEQLGQDQASALLEAFRSEAEQFVARALDPAWDSETSSVRADAVHKLAGSAAILGAAELRAFLKELESDYRRGHEAAARKRMADLQAIWDRTRNDMAACLRDAPVIQDNVRTPHP
ncbi:MAG: ATP-binding protein [Tabrizicola sp.]|jgi:PAS domain S-box-containing protein|nr:ATP-binding protein [Tabrizicola sp.]